MQQIIATVVGIILVLGLISYVLLSQVSGVRDVGDNAAIEQSKISQMVQDSSVVTGSNVKSYYEQKQSIVMIKDTKDESMDIEEVEDGALFTMEKNYNADGKLYNIKFRQIDLSKDIK